MDILKKLADLGFAAESVNKGKRGESFRIITANGWTYERFADEAAVELWATKHKPEGK
jgi:hypothetical protein